MSARTKSYWIGGSCVLAMAIQLGWAGSSSAQSQTAQTTADQPPTVVVTAEKRKDVVLNVPMGITALSGAQLARTQSYRLEDYVGTVPGLTLIAQGGEQNSLVIRGLSTGNVVINSQVATYIDETPYTLFGSFTGGAFGGPNLDTFDLQRIEVLKGPQGTLYGANALGGLLKFVTNAPDPSAFGATIESGVSSVDHGGVGGDVHAMVNAPLGQDAALRVVGYDNDDPGFIDDPSRGAKDINGARNVGVRASLLYQPNSNFSIRLNALFQDRYWSDNPDEDVNPPTLTPIFGDLIQERLISQPGHALTQVYNATVDWNLGFAKLTSATSYIDNKESYRWDRSDALGGIVSSIFGRPLGLLVDSDYEAHVFSQELRLASQDQGPLQWQVGGYYTDQRGGDPQVGLAIDAPTKTILLPDPFDIGAFFNRATYQEYAGYANADYHLTPTFDVSLGGRYSWNNQSYGEVGTGLFGCCLNFSRTSSENVFTWSGDGRWHVTPSTMLYVRIASGFTPGGPNDVFATAPGIPATYAASTAVNYEVGVKSSLLDNRLTAAVDAFYITWSNIQINVNINGLGFTGDGGSAHSEGVEWDFAYVPIRGLSLDFNGAYNDAYITQAGAGSGDAVGDKLPGVPLWQMSASARYERPVMDNYSGFAEVDWRHASSRFADFELGSPRSNMPSYDIFDLRAGVDAPKWSLTLFVKNVGNEIAINYVTPNTLGGGFGAQAANVYTPRTYGATVTAKF